MAPKANPNCRECGGTGIVETVDYVDYGSTTVPMTQSWTCDCVLDSSDENENEDEE